MLEREQNERHVIDALGEYKCDAYMWEDVPAIDCTIYVSRSRVVQVLISIDGRSTYLFTSVYVNPDPKHAEP
jgi:hypothetical protein